MRSFVRRARDYHRYYRVLDMEGNIEGQQMIDKMRKVQNEHRDLIDMEPGFFNNQYESLDRGWLSLE